MTLRRITLALLILYALITAWSIFGRPLGIAPDMVFTPLVTLTGFAFAFVHAGQRESWGGAVRLLVLVFGVSLLFESVGVATGLVYGPYHYTDQLGPKFLGLVPYLIPAAWFMMSYPSFVIADRLVPVFQHEGHHPKKAGASGSQRMGKWVRVLLVAAVGGLAMTAWDLVMDPIMVASGHWVWDAKGAYFGIPLQNFWGWWLTIFTTFALYLWLGRSEKWFAGVQVLPPETGQDRLALLSYLVTALGIISAAFLSGAGALGLIGIFAMLPWAVAGGLKMVQE